jgi:quercetin dioxygenase-like cupin family protein
MRYSTTLLLLAAMPLFSQARKPDLENDQVRVLVVTEQPHVKTSLHKHDVNRVMIYLNAGKQEFVIEGKNSEVVYKAGEAKWSPAGGMHTAELMSGEPMKIVEVEIKKPGDPAKVISTALDPPKIDKQDYQVEFENNQVRVVRVKMAAHR